MQDTAIGGVGPMLAVRADAVDADTVPRMVAEDTLTPTWGPRLAATLVAPEHEELVAAALLDPDPPVTTPASFTALADTLARAALPVLREHGPLTKAELGEALLPQTPAHTRVDCSRCGRVHPHEELVKMLVWTNRLRLDAGDRHGNRVAPAARWRPRRFRRVRDDQHADLVRRSSDSMDRPPPSTSRSGPASTLATQTAAGSRSPTNWSPSTHPSGRARCSPPTATCSMIHRRPPELHSFPEPSFPSPAVGCVGQPARPPVANGFLALRSTRWPWACSNISLEAMRQVASTVANRRRRPLEGWEVPAGDLQEGVTTSGCGVELCGGVGLHLPRSRRPRHRRVVPGSGSHDPVQSCD